MNVPNQESNTYGLSFTPEGRVLYMGYSLLLSPCEEILLRESWDSRSLSGGEDCDQEPAGSSAVGSLVRAVARRINRKADALSGRDLLRAKEGQGVSARPFR